MIIGNENGRHWVLTYITYLFNTGQTSRVGGTISLCDVTSRLLTAESWSSLGRDSTPTRGEARRGAEPRERAGFTNGILLFVWFVSWRTREMRTTEAAVTRTKRWLACVTVTGVTGGKVTDVTEDEWRVSCVWYDGWSDVWCERLSVSDVASDYVECGRGRAVGTYRVFIIKWNKVAVPRAD